MMTWWMHNVKWFTNVVVMPYLRAIETDIANMLYDTCELIVKTRQQIISKLRIRINSLFLYYFTSYWKWIQNWRDGPVKYKATLEYYTEKPKCQRSVPIIKVFTKTRTTSLSIVVPFTDGIKSLNVVTDLKKAYWESSTCCWFRKNITLSIVDEAWKTLA
jgi:preprotein translocase subunit SecA